jgi:hypothetical protein
MTGHVIVLSRAVDASNEDVWQVLTDVTGQELHLRHVQEVEVLTDGPYAVGTRWREHRTLLGHRGVETLEVVECAPARHATVRIASGRDEVSLAYAISPHGDTCRLSVTMAADTSGRSPLGKLRWGTWGLFDLEQTRRMLVADLADIAAAAETRS